MVCMCEGCIKWLGRHGFVMINECYVLTSWEMGAKKMKNGVVTVASKRKKERKWRFGFSGWDFYESVSLDYIIFNVDMIESANNNYYELTR